MKSNRLSRTQRAELRRGLLPSQGRRQWRRQVRPASSLVQLAAKWSYAVGSTHRRSPLQVPNRRTACRFRNIAHSFNFELALSDLWLSFFLNKNEMQMSQVVQFEWCNYEPLQKSQQQHASPALRPTPTGRPIPQAINSLSRKSLNYAFR